MEPDYENEHSQMVRDLSKPGKDIASHLSNNPELAHLWHMATLVAGEAGELLDAIKKHVVYGKEADTENVLEELGDLEFGLSAIRDHFGFTRKQSLAHNMSKLLTGKNARYSEGSYSDKAAQERTDKKIDLSVYIAPSTGIHYTQSPVGANGYALYWKPKANSWGESALILNKHLVDKFDVLEYIDPTLKQVMYDALNQAN